jgi:hypothetical protein
VLYKALPNGALTGYRLAKDFDASANGVSFGRYVKSDGGTDFVAMSSRTFGNDSPSTVAQFRAGTGMANSYPLVGPLVISEIFYEPPPIIVNGVPNDNSIDEFIELTSITNDVLKLFDPNYPTNAWRLQGGISFDFPLNTTVSANASLLLVNFDPKTNLTQLAAFRSRYGVSENVPLFGPYAGKLNNSSDSVQLEKPDPVQLPPHPDAGFVPFVLVEKLKYESANDWPTNASGTGFSIQRLNLAGYANDQTNWFAALPTPGKTSSPPPEIRLLEPSLTQTGFQLSFLSTQAQSYTVEFTSSFSPQDWTSLTNLTGNGGLLTVEDKTMSATGRFYRVRSP